LTMGGMPKEVAQCIFAKVDADKSGEVEEAEFKSADHEKIFEECTKPSFAQAVAECDAGAKDGKISEAEAVACLAKQGLSPEIAKCIFAKVDTSGDGQVVEEEFNKFNMADAGSCFAGPPPPPPQAKGLMTRLGGGMPSWETVVGGCDTGAKDGKLSKAEAVACLTMGGMPKEVAQCIFAKVDADKSGEVDEAEFKGADHETIFEECSKPSFAQAVAECDKGAKDGKISEAEAVACLAKQGLSPEVAKCIFGKVDADKSGKVEEEEFNKFKMADAGSCFAGGPPAPPPPQAKGLKTRLGKGAPAPPAPPTWEQAVGGCDAGEKDGKLSKDEAVACLIVGGLPKFVAECIFDKVDADESGKVDEAEFKAADHEKVFEECSNKPAWETAVEECDTGDKDGKISEAEATVCLAKQGLSPESAKCIFDKVDSDKSGKVNETEFKAFKSEDAAACFPKPDGPPPKAEAPPPAK